VSYNTANSGTGGRHRFFQFRECIVQCCCRDELKAAWKAFTPILHAIDNGEIMMDRYPAGSRGPPSADAIISKAGFRYTLDPQTWV